MVLSIEIEEQNIKIIEGTKKGKALVVHKHIMINMASDSISDGKIRNIESVRETVEKALLSNVIKTKKTIFVINSSSVLIRKIELPLLKRKRETISMIKNELEHILSVNLNHIIAYKKSDTLFRDGIHRAKYIVYALPLNIYNEYIELGKMLKLDLIAIYLSFNCLQNIAFNNLTVNKKSIEEQNTVGFFDIGYKTLCFSVLKGGYCDFSRLSNNGVDGITECFMHEFNLTFHEAKNELGNLTLIESRSNIWENVKISIAKDCINVWINEINRYIRYYNSLNKDKLIEKIYVYGYAEIEGLEEYLSLNLNEDVEIIRELSGVEIEHTEYLNSALALYSNEGDMNLLRHKRKIHTIKFASGIFLLTVCIMLVLNFVYYSLGSIYKRSMIEKESEAMSIFFMNNKNIDIFKNAEKLKNKAHNLAKNLKSATELKKLIAGENIVDTKMIRKIYAAATNNSKINSVMIHDKIMQLHCTSASMNDVSLFIKNIRKIEAVESIHISEILMSEAKEETEEKFFAYSLICNLKDVSYEIKQ